MPPFSPWSRRALVAITILSLVMGAGFSTYLIWPDAAKLFPLHSFFVYIALSGYFIITLITLIGLHKQRTSADGHAEAYHALAQELSQVANKSEIVINAIADGVIATDGKGIIQLINPAAQAILGWGKQDAINLDYRSVLKIVTGKGEPLPEDSGPVQQVLHGGDSVTRNDLMLETNSGKKIDVSLLVSPIGKFGNGAIVVFRDITSEVSEGKQRAEFISTASHEMRTPVAAIEGYLGLALNPATAQIDDKARLYLDKAHESAQHLGRLFQDLLDVSKAEDGRLKNDPKIVELVSFTRDSVAIPIQKAQEKGLSLIFQPDVSEEATSSIAPIFYVQVDPDHLRETLSNLIENAIKYTKEGSITVNVTGTEKHATVSVTDTGIGIAAEDLPHLFQKFYRIDNTETREIGGTGLGLYLCRRLVESMNGHLSVKSEVGKGSTFFVELERLAQEQVDAYKNQLGPL